MNMYNEGRAYRNLRFYFVDSSSLSAFWYFGMILWYLFRQKIYSKSKAQKKLGQVEKRMEGYAVGLKTEGGGVYFSDRNDRWDKIQEFFQAGTIDKLLKGRHIVIYMRVK